jgi:hypothetical protein
VCECVSIVLLRAVSNSNSGSQLEGIVVSPAEAARANVLGSCNTGITFACVLYDSAQTLTQSVCHVNN